MKGKKLVPRCAAGAALALGLALAVADPVAAGRKERTGATGLEPQRASDIAEALPSS